MIFLIEKITKLLTFEENNPKNTSDTVRKINNGDFFWNVNRFKFCVADDTQVIGGFSRDYRRIFINGMSLERIYEDMQITVNQQNFLLKADLVRLWSEYCFVGSDEKQLLHWQQFANALFHQGGLLYGFESILKEKMSSPDNNSKAFFPQNTKKEVHIRFDKQGLTVKKIVFLQRLKILKNRI